MKDEQLDGHLRAWAEVPLPAALSARTLAHARAAFESAGQARARRVGALATTAAVVSAVAIYLTWAVEFLSALARG
jgi:hypothetical protein